MPYQHRLGQGKSIPCDWRSRGSRSSFQTCAKCGKFLCARCAGFIDDDGVHVNKTFPDETFICDDCCEAEGEPAVNPLSTGGDFISGLCLEFSLVF